MIQLDQHISFQNGLGSKKSLPMSNKNGPGNFRKTEPFSSSLVFQIPCEDRCLNPQISPEVRLLGVPFTPPHKVFGGFWMSRVSTPFDPHEKTPVRPGWVLRVEKAPASSVVC